PYPSAASPIGLITVFAPLALMSLFVWNADLPPGESRLWNWLIVGPSRDVWITRFFCMFFLGASAWAALDGLIPRAGFWRYAAALGRRIVTPTANEGWGDALTLGLSAALLAGVSTYVAGCLGRLGSWLNNGVLQYLGRISYRLFLIHFPMSPVITTLG